MFRYYKWEEVNINWEGLNMTWEEVGIMEEIIGSIAAPISGKQLPDFLKMKELNKLPQEKKLKIIKIVCKIIGDDKEYISYKYKNDDIKITANHINIIINEVLKNKIEVNVQNIS